MQNEKFCTKCGQVLGEGVKFCGNCGEMVEVAAKERENYFSWQWRITIGFFFVAVIFALVGYIGAAFFYAIAGVLVCPKIYRNFKSKSVAIAGAVLCFVIGVILFLSHEDDKFIDSVKNGYLTGYEDEVVGEAFERFFSDTSWEYFESEDGTDVVEFEGKYMKNDRTRKVKIQFVVEGDEFYIGYMEINGQSQDDFQLFTLLEAIYE